MSLPAADLELIAAIANDLPVGVWVARAPRGELVYANQTFAEIMGMGARPDVAAGEYAAPYGIHARDGNLYPEGELPFVRALQQRRTVTVDDIVIHRTDGGRVHIRATARPIFDAAGEISHVVIAFIDISREAAAEKAQEESEDRLAHAQKMETVGTLAGGVAHDFNNLLAAIKIFVSTLRLDETDLDKRETLDHMAHVVDTGAALTQALLGLARHGASGGGSHAVRVSVHEAVRSVLAIVERTTDPRILVESELGADLADIVGDRSQLEQVLLNLALNARDALPASGRILVRARNVLVDDAQANLLPPLRPGPHVALEVEDDGPGIPQAIRSRIFEPYFTTKTGGAQRGTGLGLATVWSIIQSHRASIEVLDGHPRGTLMRVLFAAAGAEVPALPPPLEPTRVQAGQGTILLIEDDPRVRAATQLALRAIGHEVVTATDGAEGVELFRAERSRIVAIVLDLAMPRMNGREALQQIRALDPLVPVLLTTAVPLGREVQEMIDLGARLLPKPYDLSSLSLALREVIHPAL